MVQFTSSLIWMLLRLLLLANWCLEPGSAASCCSLLILLVSAASLGLLLLLPRLAPEHHEETTGFHNSRFCLLSVHYCLNQVSLQERQGLLLGEKSLRKLSEPLARNDCTATKSLTTYKLWLIHILSDICMQFETHTKGLRDFHEVGEHTHVLILIGASRSVTGSGLDSQGQDFFSTSQHPDWL
jgi:hypothetical protein